MRLVVRSLASAVLTLSLLGSAGGPISAQAPSASPGPTATPSPTPIPVSCVVAAPAASPAPAASSPAPSPMPAPIEAPLKGRSTYRTSRWPGVWQRVKNSPLAVRVGAFASVERSGRRVTLVAWGGTKPDGTLRMDGTTFRVGTERWDRIPDAPLCPRTGAGVVLWGSRLIVWGGTTPDGTPLVDGAIYGLRSGRWDLLPAAPIVSGPFRFTAWSQPTLIGAGEDGRLTMARLSLGPDEPRWTEVEAVPLPVGERVELTGIGNTADELVISYLVDGTAAAVRRRGDFPVAWEPVGALPVPLGTGGGPTRGLAGDTWVRSVAGPAGAIDDEVILHEAADPATGWRRWVGVPGGVRTDQRLLWTPDRLISPDAMVAWSPMTHQWRPLLVNRLDAQVVWVAGGLYVWGGHRTDGSAAHGLFRFTPALPGARVALPRNDRVGGCDLSAIDASRMRLRGAKDDPRVAWFEGPGRTIPSYWPDGYTARFTPELAILDPLGRVIAREGDVPRQWARFRFAGQRVCFWPSGAWFLGPME